ncbi:MAG TPA: endonuclease domain-containing protein [Gammaproteobacteria bacterium]|nr:endonuclease domain-containing protein [Gammaproteobacteria bacterium]
MARIALCQLGGFRFRRQAVIGPYIADFVCQTVRVVIEVDGGHHNEEEVMVYDQDRTEWFNTQGYLVKRFWNNEVLKNINSIKEVILKTCISRTNTPHPSLRADFPHKWGSGVLSSGLFNKAQQVRGDKEA